jgi:hypothetical protein
MATRGPAAYAERAVTNGGAIGSSIALWVIVAVVVVSMAWSARARKRARPDDGTWIIDPDSDGHHHGGGHHGGGHLGDGGHGGGFGGDGGGGHH